MATFTRSDDLQGAEFVDADLRGARFVGADLSGVVMRGVERGGGGHRRPVALRRRELLARQRRRRDPIRRGRTQPPLSRPRRPARRGSGWAARGLGRARAHMGGHARARRGDAGRHGRRLGGRRVVVRADAAAPGPRHGHVAGSGDPGDRAAIPPHRSSGRRAPRTTAWTCRSSRRSHRRTPRCSRSGRVASRWCATSSPPSHRTMLAATRKNPWAPEYPETTLSCLHVILEEEWEHHRYAVRDLDAIEAKSDA